MSSLGEEIVASSSATNSAQPSTSACGNKKTLPLQFKESEEWFKERLKRTALGLPAAVVSKAVRDMHRHVRMVLTEKGGLFNE